MRVLLAVVLLSVLVVPGTALAVEYDAVASRRAPLKGLTGVRVFASFNRNDTNITSITEESLTVDVELNLRRYGIKVFTQDNWASSPSFPALSLKVSVMKSIETGPCVSMTVLELTEIVSLKRKAGKGPVTTTATTWSDSILGVMGSVVVEDSTREWARDLVDKFSNDYLAVNPTPVR